MSDTQTTAPTVEDAAEAAWLAYRAEYARTHPWCSARRASRQMRKREFIAGYRAALAQVTLSEKGNN